MLPAPPPRQPLQKRPAVQWDMGAPAFITEHAARNRPTTCVHQKHNRSKRGETGSEAAALLRRAVQRRRG